MKITGGAGSFLLVAGLLGAGLAQAQEGYPEGFQLPEHYAFPVVAENVADPLGSEAETVEIYKRAAHALSEKWNIMFVYDDRCAPRSSDGDARLEAAGRPLPSEGEAPAPTKVFDNVYYLGLDDVASWAFVENDGEEIYILDALNNAEEAEQYIAGGLETLGFDPANIKAVFIGHGHGDHYGGAKYLQETYGADVYMGADDWGPVLRDGADEEGRWFGLSPAFDFATPVDEPFQMGDTTIQFFETPGHTPGTVSALIPVTFNGEKHLAAFWGGTGYPRGSIPTLETYIESITNFSRAAREAGADIFMSNHSHSDAAVQRFPSIDFEAGKTDMIWGADYVSDLLDVLNLCARAQLERQLIPGNENI